MCGWLTLFHAHPSTIALKTLPCLCPAYSCSQYDPKLCCVFCLQFSVKCEWKEATSFAKLLSEQSRWSKVSLTPSTADLLRLPSHVLVQVCKGGCYTFCSVSDVQYCGDLCVCAGGVVMVLTVCIVSGWRLIINWLVSALPV